MATIYGEDGVNDVLVGGPEDDLIDGRSGDDSIDSDGGQDFLYGGEGNDTLLAGDENDVLNGGAGNDSLQGGPGVDTYMFGAGSGSDVVFDQDGQVMITGGLTANDVRLERNGDSLVIVLEATGDRLTLQDWFLGGARIESIMFENESILDAGDIVDANNAPTVEAPLADQSAQAGSAFSFAMPAGTFGDSNSGDQLAFSASLADGSELPSWLTFNPATGQFSGTAPAGATAVEVMVTATDLLGAQTSDVFSFAVAANEPQGRRIIGTNRDDRLFGTDGDDYIDGRRGFDTMAGGKGDDVYYVDASRGRRDHGHWWECGRGRHGKRTDQVVERANEGWDTVFSSASYILPVNVEALHLLGSKSIDGTGNAAANWIEGNRGNNDLAGGAGDDFLQGGRGNDELRGDKGIDVLQGGRGNDELKDKDGKTVFDGGAGNDEMTGGGSADFFAGGRGNDELELGGGRDVIAFNKGDGVDHIEGECQSGVLSLGGGIRYEDLRFRKDGKDLVLETGGSDRLVFDDWYKGNKSVVTLQVVAEAMSGFSQTSGDQLRNDRVEVFNFGKLVDAFDDARARHRNMDSWRLMGELLDAHLYGSDDAALGGDLAYRYGMNGSLEGMSWDAAQGTVAAAGFGQQKQALQPLAQLPDDTIKLGA